jgi:hypothetical protein
VQNGKYDSAAKICTMMMKDDRLSALVQSRLDNCFASEFSFVKALRAPSRVAAAVATLCDEVVDVHSLKKHLMNRILLSASVMQYDPYNRALNVPSMVGVRHNRSNEQWYMYAQWYTLEDQKIDTHVYMPSDATYEERRLDPTEWLISVGDVDTSLFKSLGERWVRKQDALRDWARLNYVHGLPFIKAKTPQNSEPGTDTAFLNQLGSISSGGIVECPQGETAAQSYDVELIQATDSAHASFFDLINGTDDSYAINVLRQNLSTSVEGGSYAATRVHYEKEIALAAVDRAMINRDVNEMLRKIVQTEMNVDMSTVGSYVLVDPPHKIDPETLIRAVEAYKQLVSIGINVDKKQYFSTLGLAEFDLEGV